MRPQRKKGVCEGDVRGRGSHVGPAVRTPEPGSLHALSPGQATWICSNAFYCSQLKQLPCCSLSTYYVPRSVVGALRLSKLLTHHSHFADELRNVLQMSASVSRGNDHAPLPPPPRAPMAPGGGFSSCTPSCSCNHVPTRLSPHKAGSPLKARCESDPCP